MAKRMMTSSPHPQRGPRARGWACLAGVAYALGAGPARAEDAKEFGSKHQIIVSAERLFGVAHGSRVTKEVVPDGLSSTTLSFEDTGTTLGPLGSWGETTTIYMVPRLALDVLVVKGLSIGSGLTYFRSSVHEAVAGEIAALGPATTVDVLLLAPR